MEGLWLASYVALWTLVIALGLVVLVHSRLLGLLHHRVGPKAARPLADGPALGTRLPRLTGVRLDGSPWVREFPARADLVTVFVSPQCEMCNALVGHLKDFAAAAETPPLVVVSAIDDLAMNRAYSAYVGLDTLEFIVGGRLATDLQVEGTPYALYLDREGVVRAKGIVNNFEHLISLKAHAAGPAAFEASAFFPARSQP